MNGLFKKALTVMLSTTLLTSTIPTGNLSTVVALENDVAQVYDNTWEQTLVGNPTNHTGEYTVSSAEDWNNLEDESNFDGKTVVLTADITFTSTNNTLTNFAGTLDGNGYTIKGVTKPLIGTLNAGAIVQNLVIDGASVSATTSDVAVLANKATLSTSEDVTVTNVAITNATVTGARRAGALISVVTGGDASRKLILTNCAVSGSITGGATSDHDSAGGLLARANTSTPTVQLVNCRNSASITIAAPAKNHHVGGLVGFAQSPFTAENCLNEGTVSVKDTTGGNANLGGIVGYAKAGATFTSCTNTGNISGEDTLEKNIYIGGIYATADAAVELTDCHNTGNLTSGSTKTSGDHVAAGICAIMGAVSFTATNCTNSGTISARSYTGGIIARVRGTTSISGCTNTGSVTGKTGYAGGVLGYSDALINITISNSCNEGAISSGSSHAGGLMSYSLGSSVAISDSSNKGTVSSTNRSGGLLGFFSNLDNADNTTASTLVVSNSVNDAEVTGKNQTGGIVGYCTSSNKGTATMTISISNSINKGKITSTNAQVGGICGQCTPKGGTTTVTNFVNYAELVGSSAAGGLFGLYNGGDKLTVSNAVNMGAVSAVKGPAAGILAYANTIFELNNCVNTSTVLSCVSNGAFTQTSATDTYTAAGIFGYTNNANANGSKITDCVNTGTVMAPRNAAGIMGYGKNGTAVVTIDGCANNGELISCRYSGGIVGASNASVVVNNCQVTGTVALKDVTETNATKMAVISVSSGATVTNCIGYVDMGEDGDYSKVAWLNGAEVVGADAGAILSEMAVLNLEVQKGAADANGNYSAIFLAGMNKLSYLTAVGFEVIRVVDGKISNTVDTNGTGVYSALYGFDANGAQKDVLATDYSDAGVVYLSAMEIYNISNTENVTYIYRPYAVKTVEGESTTLYGTWNSVTFAAVAQ